MSQTEAHPCQRLPVEPAAHNLHRIEEGNPTAQTDCEACEAAERGVRTPGDFLPFTAS